MKFLILSLISLVSLFDLKVFCLQSNAVCKNTNEECAGRFSLDLVYFIRCEKICCSNEYPFSCSSENHFCAQSKQACDQFLRIREFINLMFKMPKDQTKYKKFHQEIKPCPTKMKTKINPNDVCSVGKNCYLSWRTNASIKSFIAYLTKKIVCPCQKGRHTYQCSNMFCTKNNLVCASLLKQLPAYGNNTFQKCLNDNIIIRKNKF
jgi:hypothetical protein